MERRTGEVGMKAGMAEEIQTVDSGGRRSPFRHHGQVAEFDVLEKLYRHRLGPAGNIDV